MDEHNFFLCTWNRCRTWNCDFVISSVYRYENLLNSEKNGSILDVLKKLDFTFGSAPVEPSQFQFIAMKFEKKLFFVKNFLSNSSFHGNFIYCPKWLKDCWFCNFCFFWSILVNLSSDKSNINLSYYLHRFHRRRIVCDDFRSSWQRRQSCACKIYGQRFKWQW